MKYIVAVLVLCLSAFIYFFMQQDSDLVLRFYQSFGPEPCSVLRGKVVWITGASSGIGRQLAYDLAGCGCKLVLSARRKQKLEEVKEKCAEINPSYNLDDDIMVQQLDVTSFSSHVDLTNHVIEKFGQIDILVNNAGVGSVLQFVEKTSFEVEKRVVETNLLGVMSLTKAVLPHMLKRQEGQIVLVGSGLAKYVFPGAAEYSASKFGIQAYVDTLRYEVSSRNIKVVNILPGLVISDVFKSALCNDLKKAQDSSDFEDLAVDIFGGMKFMPTERCTYLMMVAMANELQESWISTRAFLSAFYKAHYLRII